MVTITDYREEGTCGFCRKESKEGVTCEFDDGSFKGFLCLNDFKKFLRLKFTKRGEANPSSMATAAGR